jgi:hypothetical protein
MATDQPLPQEPAEEVSGSERAKPDRREIKGGIPYVSSPGVLKKTLELIIPAERPDNFSGNFMSTILKLTGGSARAVPPFLKKMQFIGSDATPTGLYSKFKTDGGRSQAAYDGLRNAFSELFKRNSFIHKADEATVRDLIVEITGLKKSDRIVALMYASFDAVRVFISGDVGQKQDDVEEVEKSERSESIGSDRSRRSDGFGIGLAYNINIILPETENIEVFNSIFKSLRDNLLK